MNICMCGIEAGYGHRLSCPYPLYRGSERDELRWMDAEARKRSEFRRRVREAIEAERVS